MKLRTAIDAAAVWRHSGSTAVLTMNRPNILNPLTEDICRDLKHILVEWKKSSDVSCLIVRGNGKAFCAGGDVKALWQALSAANVADIGISDSAFALSSRHYSIVCAFVHQNILSLSTKGGNRSTN